MYINCKTNTNIRGLFKKYSTFLYKAHNTTNFTSFIQSLSKWYTHFPSASATSQNIS